jgi:hypothetical protein
MQHMFQENATKQNKRISFFPGDHFKADISVQGWEFQQYYSTHFFCQAAPSSVCSCASSVFLLFSFQKSKICALFHLCREMLIQKYVAGFDVSVAQRGITEEMQIFLSQRDCTKSNCQKFQVTAYQTKHAV